MPLNNLHPPENLHVMSEHFKYVLREFRQAVMDAKTERLSKNEADPWRQKKLRYHRDIIEEVFLSFGQLALPLSVMGALGSFVVGHTVFDSGGAGILLGGTLGLGVGSALLLKREIIEQQLAAKHEDVEHFLHALQPLRSSEHCADTLKELGMLLNMGSLKARTLEKLEQLSKQVVNGFHDDMHQQQIVRRNQQLMNDLITPLPLVQTVNVDHGIVSQPSIEQTDDRRHLHL